MVGIRLFCIYFLLVTALSAAFSQETSLFTHEDKDFRKGIEYLEKEKYSTAQQFFQQVYNRLDQSNSILQSRAQYYVAYCAVRLFNDDAEHLTFQFIADNPGDPLINEALFNLGGYFYARKRWEEAIEYYLQVNPDRITKEQTSELFFKLGYSYFSTDQPEMAKPTLYRIKDIDARYTSPANYYYAHIHYEEGNEQTALNGFLKLTDDKTFGPIVPYYIVQIYYKQKRYSDIVEFTPGIIEKVTPKRLPEVSRITAEAYAQLNQYEESLPYYQTYLDSASTVTSDDKYQAGYAFYKAGEYKTAVQILGDISNEDTKLGQNAAYYLADCYIKLNDRANARKAFYSASRLDYDPAIKQDALFNYALISFELGSDPFNETILAFEEYIQLYPESKRIDEVYRFMVQAYLNANNYKLALASIEKAGLQSDEFKQAYQRIAFYRGIELFNNLQFTEALGMFNKSLNYGGFDKVLNARALFWKGETQYRLANYTEAVQSYNTFKEAPIAYTLNEYDRLSYCVGYSWFKQKQYQPAITAFRKFVSDAPAELATEKTDALIRIGDSYYALTDYYAAADFYGRASESSDYAILQEAICIGLQNKDIKKIQILQQLLQQYPNSEFKDDALYEMAQSYLKIQNNDRAIENLQQLVGMFPQSPYAPSASVQLGLLYYNADNTDLSIQYYKETVSKYPGTQAAKDALAGLKNLYVDVNQTDDYFAYASSLGSNAPIITASEQDSLTYISAEKKYMAGNCPESSVAFEKYLQNYPNGSFVLNAHFYKGDCNYREKEFDKALTSFTYIVNQSQNLFTEQALLGAARIEITRKQYPEAIEHYTALATNYSSPGNTKEASVAIMKAQYATQQYPEAIEWSGKVLQLKKLSPEAERDAQYILARSYQETGKNDRAMQAYGNLAAEVMSSRGAEAKYRLAELKYYDQKFDEAEKIIIEFSEMSTPHEYWIARGFILWADIFTAKGEYFQAIQTLESIIDYYQNTDDGILELARESKVKIEAQQKKHEQASEPSDMEINIE